ncbi:MAG TPA: DUF6666 family protein [Pirellulales bacterium]|nr:DUF6666 family protein [Pirellulales bacterium]
MYAAERIRRSWAIGGALVLVLLGNAPAAFAQKFARARNVDAADADDDGEAVESAPASQLKTRLIPPGSRLTRSNSSNLKTLPPPSAPPRMLKSPLSYSYSSKTAARPFVPGWQSTGGGGTMSVATSTRSGGRIIRHVPGSPIDPQEGDIIYEEPDFLNTKSRSGRKTATVAVRQGGRTFGSAEMIGPGEPTPAPGRTTIQSEGSEAPVVEESIVDDGMVIDDGETVCDGGDCGGGGFCSNCGDWASYPHSYWGPCYEDDLDPGHAVPCDGICIPRHLVDETALFLGTQGFNSPMDLGRNGNFGFHEGVNFAGHFGSWLGLGGLGLGYQVGATFLQSDLNGNQTNGVQTKERDQQFLTAGLFRRAHAGYGLQGGFVFDYMHDNYYVKYSVGQIRTELSYLTAFGHEFGFWGAYSVHDGHSMLAGVPVGFQTVNMYNGFYRYNFSNGAQGRIWVGGTDTKQGIVGSDLRLPLANRWDLWGWYNYIIPGHNGAVGSSQQGWNLTMNLVWYPGRKACGVHNTPFRALFAPADNNWLVSRPSP